MITTADENGIREQTVDELDSVTGGLGGTLGEAVQEIGSGLLHAVVQTVSEFAAATHNTVSC